MPKQLKETVSAGAIGASAIATNPGRLGFNNSFRNFLVDILKKTKNNEPKLVPIELTKTNIKEYYDLTDVVSRLKSIEGSDKKKTDITTYGVEDDKGNIMKISVRNNQAKEFEHRLAMDMAEAKENKMFDKNMNVSLAELLYNLKNDFDIVDVEFPKIPKDVVYNADKITYGPDTGTMSEDDEIYGDDPDLMDDENPNGMGDMGDMEGMDDMDMQDEEGMDGDMEDPEMARQKELNTDDESVEDFVEDDAPATPESILQNVMDMLKANAEAEKAKAEAAAEESRAKQAEYAYKAAQTTVNHEEEFAKMELEMEQQKQKEKEAKKMAKYAKHKARSVKGMEHRPLGLRESNESILFQVINELDQFDTPQSINKAMALLRSKYKPSPEDTPEERVNKQQLLAAEMRELAARRQGLKIRDRNMQMRKRKENMMGIDNNNSMSNMVR